MSIQINEETQTIHIRYYLNQEGDLSPIDLYLSDHYSAYKSDTMAKKLLDNPPRYFNHIRRYCFIDAVVLNRFELEKPDEDDFTAFPINQLEDTPDIGKSSIYSEVDYFRAFINRITGRVELEEPALEKSSVKLKNYFSALGIDCDGIKNNDSLKSTVNLAMLIKAIKVLNLKNYDYLHCLAFNLWDFEYLDLSNQFDQIIKIYSKQLIKYNMLRINNPRIGRINNSYRLLAIISELSDKPALPHPYKSLEEIFKPLSTVKSRRSNDLIYKLIS